MCTRYLTVWNDICGNSTKFGDPNCTESMDAGELIQEKGKVETLQLVLKGKQGSSSWKTRVALLFNPPHTSWAHLIFAPFVGTLEA
ncbi:uncharacterized protein LOC116849074 isoform X3 [Odontomachus brunneus]|uniref:uncharacterized protein LOC116849074 isoform X3 n=1 Tax=Odontomachus brunneus TaxID=486640 RepID=UPI0013F2ACF0|nr:uncharacterized protein LOC116849074 isoform X3 [Odontomachus brunneus]